jgi:N-acyl homoserine lactone hydrolase
LIALMALSPAKPGKSATPAPTVRLWRLDCGSFTAPRDDFSDLFSHSGERASYVDSCYLIRHGSDLLLWDAGLPSELIGKPEDLTADVRLRLRRTIVEQLAQLGIRPEQVTMIGISHMHSDHMGQASAFPQARLIMDRGDFDALRGPQTPFFTNPAMLRPWLTGGSPKDLVTGDRDVFGDGTVVMIALPGHTPGNHGLLVRLRRSGPFLLSGDALHEPDQLVDHAVSPHSADRAQALASIDRIRGIIRAVRATLLIQHDPASVAKLPVFPRYAD